MIVEMLNREELEKLREVVNEVIREINPEDFKDGEPINFGNLYCFNIEGCYSFDADMVIYTIYIKEASLEAVDFQKYIAREVEKRFYVPVFVKTEW